MLGSLRNPVLVEALFDPQASMEATLRNLLQRAGYGSLDEVRAEGEAKGLAVAARRLVASGMTVEQAAAALDLDVARVQAAVGEQGRA